ncbi:hypothetical protein [Methanocella arvoryzae]|nr:hypothetical protein [Methanocella arvoryzae]
MSHGHDEPQEQLEHIFKCYCETGLTLATLAVVRRGASTISEARDNIASYTAEMMIVDEKKLARELEDLVRQGCVELKEGRYYITPKGKNLMFIMLKQWNKYVDAMNNLWGCYYGA